MKKIILLLCIIFPVLTGCVVAEEETVDKVGNVLAAVELRSEIDFPEPVSMDVEWKTEDGVLNIAGRGFSVIDEDPEMNFMMRAILGFFNGYGFIKDEMNTYREGSDTRNWGYSQDGVACIARYLPLVETKDNENDFFVEVRCGLLEDGKLIPTEEYELSSLMKDIADNIHVDFANPKLTTFNWMVDAGDTIKTLGIKGKEMFASEVDRDLDMVQNYFKESGFEMDMHNIADGTISSLEVYRKGLLACTVMTQTTGLDEEEMPTEESKINLTISCGHLDEKLLPEISKDILIRRLFAEKYDKKESAVKIEITQEEDGFVRGMVSFEDEETPGSSGLFLARKVNDEWEIVFDGNGSFPCEELVEMNFPSDMIGDCAS